MKYEEKGAIFSSCRTYRYLLWRAWHESTPRALVVGLNPSTAGACDDDNTVKRIIDFITRAGYGGFYLANLFGFISTPSAGLFATPSPEGNPDNDRYLQQAAARCVVAIVAWGDDGTHRNRDAVILPLLQTIFIQVYCLSQTASGNPGHPLYLSSSCTPIPFP